MLVGKCRRRWQSLILSLSKDGSWCAIRPVNSTPRWQIEVTFEEARAHLGMESQRQWSDRAILRTTPALLGLFSLTSLWVHDLRAARNLVPRAAAWYPKAHLTFSDAIAAVRREIWQHQNS